MPEPVISLLRIRVINRFDAGNSEVTNDLPHLHQTEITTVAMQPGNPGSSALGAFTIRLHPPGSDKFAAAKPIYDQLRRYQRVEFYISHDGVSLGKLFPGAGGTGIITGIRKSLDKSPAYELTGVSDVGLANYSRPFPGELLSNDTTDKILQSYLGTNELGWSDAFSTFTAGNYTSSNLPGHTAGTWTSSTDDGLNVVTVSTGTGAELISKTSTNSADRWFTQYVEVTGRLTPSSLTDAGEFGVGFSKSSANMNDSVVGYALLNKAAGRYRVTGSIINYSAGSVFANQQLVDVLSNVDDPQGNVPLTVGLLMTLGGNSNATGNVTLFINGKAVIQQYVVTAVSNRAYFPCLHFGIGTGAGPVGFFTNFAQFVRFTTDGPSTAAAFGNGTISASANSLSYGNDPGPNFLETWSRLATRNGWYWRYTPQAYAIGTRTLGTVDFAADPGTDLTNKVIFRRRDGNLVGLQFNNNNDPLSADTALTGQPTPDGAGIGYWRDIPTLAKYGVIQDEALGFTHSDFNSLRRASLQVLANKIALDTLGAKTATVLRDPRFADTYRELDKITVDDPEMGLNNAAVRIMARTFTEGSATEILILDQFTEDFGA